MDASHLERDFEAWAKAEGLMCESHGVMSGHSNLSLLQKAWLAGRAQQASAEPIYQVWCSRDSCEECWEWADTDESEYDSFPEQSRRILYTQPPREELKPLTDEEVWNNTEIMSANADLGAPMHVLMRIVRAVEEAHGPDKDRRG
jgi:hypothetical protein